MSIIARTSSKVNLAPVPSNVSRVLFDGTARVKAPYVFGRGIHASRPHFTVPFTAEDAAWAAAAFADNDYPPDEVLDVLADEAMAQSRLDRGLCL